MTVFRFIVPRVPVRWHRPGVLLPALLLVACASAPAPQAPANAPLAAAALPPEHSVISMPVTIDLDQVAAGLLRELPRPLLRRTWRQPLPVRRSSLQTSIATGPGSCSVMALDCLEQHSVHTVAAESVATVVAEVTQEMQLRRLSLFMEGSRLALQAQVEVTLSTRLPAGAQPLGETDCGQRGRRARFEWLQDGHVGWSPAGEVVMAAGTSSMRWLQPCAVTAFSTEAMLDLPGLRERLAQALEGQVLGRLRNARLALQLERAWPELNSPRELRPGVWLLPHPARVSVADLVGRGNRASTAILVEARPEIVRGARPAVRIPPLPVPGRGGDVGDGLRLAVRGDLALSEAGQRLQQRLGGALRRVGGSPVRLERVRIWGHGGQAVLALGFGEPALAELHVLARAVYDPERNEVGLRDLAFAPATRRYLARVAPWLAVPGLLSALEAEARFDFDPGLAGAVNGVSELRQAAGQDLTLRGGVQRVQPQALYFTRDRLVALLLLEGRLALEARQK
ncbi:MAG: DUF4403 family protein [Pseudomonadota bacterium]